MKIFLIYPDIIFQNYNFLNVKFLCVLCLFVGFVTVRILQSESMKTLHSTLKLYYLHANKVYWITSRHEPWSSWLLYKKVKSCLLLWKKEVWISYKGIMCYNLFVVNYALDQIPLIVKRQQPAKFEAERNFYFSHLLWSEEQTFHDALIVTDELPNYIFFVFIKSQ